MSGGAKHGGMRQRGCKGARLARSSRFEQNNQHVLCHILALTLADGRKQQHAGARSHIAFGL